jgi:hypothetical protein
MLVEYSHMFYSLTWAVIYAIFAAIIVTTDTIRDWPYFFLDANTEDRIGLYAAIIIAGIFFYTIWWILSELKICLDPQIHEDDYGFEEYNQNQSNAVVGFA